MWRGRARLHVRRTLENIRPERCSRSHSESDWKKSGICSEKSRNREEKRREYINTNTYTHPAREAILKLGGDFQRPAPPSGGAAPRHSGVWPRSVGWWPATVRRFRAPRTLDPFSIVSGSRRESPGCGARGCFSRPGLVSAANQASVERPEEAACPARREQACVVTGLVRPKKKNKKTNSKKTRQEKW